MKNITLSIVAVLALAVTGCANKPPLTQVYAARQTYTGSLNALTAANQSGKIHDRATLLAIRDVRAKIEKGLDDAEAAARNGSLNFQFLMNQVNGWLEEYLTLQKPVPATRPTSFNLETPWTPQRSSPSSWAALRPLPHSVVPCKRSATAGNSQTSKWPGFVPSRLLLRPATMPL
jgi:hypothetical protein